MSLLNDSIDIRLCNDKKAGLHTHNFLELVYVLDGSAKHKIDSGDERVISKGDYFIIDYNTAHEYKSVSDSKFTIVNCLFLPSIIDKSLTYCQSFQTLISHYLIKIDYENIAYNPANHVFCDDDNNIITMINEMTKEYNEKSMGWIEVIRSNLIKIIMYTARKISVSNNPNDVISRIIGIIQKKYDTHLTLSSIANDVNYSLPYISKRFKEETGSTFQDYLKKVRIDEACRYLANTDKKIFDICHLVGYRDVDFFYKIFKSEMGITPKIFRKQIHPGNVGVDFI